eukprot:744270-Amphidinium_carterae.1
MADHAMSESNVSSEACLDRLLHPTEYLCMQGFPLWCHCEEEGNGLALASHPHCPWNADYIRALA